MSSKPPSSQSTSPSDSPLLSGLLHPNQLESSLAVLNPLLSSPSEADPSLPNPLGTYFVAPSLAASALDENSSNRLHIEEAHVEKHPTERKTQQTETHVNVSTQSNKQPIERLSAKSFSKPSTTHPPESALTGAEGLFGPTEETPRSGLKWLILSAILGLLAVGGSISYALLLRQPSSELAAVQTAPLEETTLETQVDASGVVELGEQQTITAPGDVIVETVLVDDQARVQAGQVLLEIRDRTLQQQIADQMLQQEIYRLDLDRHQVLLMQQAVILRNAEERLAESRSLLEEGFIAQSEYEQDKDDLAEAKAQLDTTEIDVKQADLTLLGSETALETLESQLADNQIRAPFDAVVLKINVQPGDGVSTEKPLLTLGNPNQEIIRFELSTLDAQSVEVDMPVRVSVIGPDAQKYTGRVIWIAPQAISSAEDSEQSQPKVEAKAVLDRPSGELIPGSKVSLEIITAQRQAVLSVPLSALSTEGDRSFVWIKDAQGNAQKRAVTLGLQTLDAVEIVSGLSADDKVIVSLPSDQALTPGMPILSSGE